MKKDIAIIGAGQPALRQTDVSSSSENPYPAAWENYQSSVCYKTSIHILKRKGLTQPYIDNILRSAFDAGYNSNR